MKPFNLANLTPTRIEVIEACIASRANNGFVEEIAYADLDVLLHSGAANDEEFLGISPTPGKIMAFG